MNEQILLFLAAIITMVILWQSYKINDYNVEGIIFGIRIPEKYRDNKKVKEVKREYNMRVTILTIINVIVFFCIYVALPKVYIFIVYVYSLTFVTIYGCYFANKKLKIIKDNIGWGAQSENKVYVQIGKKREQQDGNFKLFYIAEAISILGLLITIFMLPSLPKMVPIHFGLNGPDNWVDSTTLGGKLQIIALPIVSIFCVCSMIYCAKFQAKKEITQFNGGTISSLLLKKSYSIKSMNKMLGLISLGVSMMIFYGILLVLKIVEFTNVSNYVFIIMTLGVILIPLLYWAYDAKRVKNLKSENNNGEKEIYRDDDKYYIGGMFYYNPNDPSNIVKKRIGYGIDFNYAHIIGKLAIIIGILLFLGIAIMMILLNI